MAIGTHVDLRNGRLKAIKDAIDAGTGPGTIKLYDGTRPATGGALSGNTLLATITLVDPCAPDPTIGRLEFTDPATVTAVATGTPTWARVEDSDSNFVMDMDAGAVGSGAEIEVDTLPIEQDGSVNVTFSRLEDQAYDGNLVAPNIEVNWTTQDSGRYTIEGDGKRVTSEGHTGTPLHMCIGDIGHSIGKRYFEVLCEDINHRASNQHVVGGIVTDYNATGAVYSTKSIVILGTGNRRVDAGPLNGGTSAYSDGDVFRIAIDFDVGEVTFGRNGLMNGAPSVTFTPGDIWYPALTFSGDGNISVGYFGTSLLRPESFPYGPPAGFLPWSQQT